MRGGGHGTGPTAGGGTRTVPAAGGVVLRSSGRGTEVLLVHRPRYDDWTLPKGKLEPGEHPLHAAVREVFEETGVRGVPVRRLPAVRYLTGKPGVEKTVEYWLMRVHRATGREPDDEVDAVGWFGWREAAVRLTYRHDRGVLAAVDTDHPVTAVVVVAAPGFVAAHPGAVRLLRLFRPCGVVVGTGAGAPGSLAGSPATVEAADWDRTDPRATAAAIRSLAATAASTVVYVDPPVLAASIVALRPECGAAAGTHAPAEACWVLSFAGTDPVAATAVPVAVAAEREDG